MSEFRKLAAAGILTGATLAGCSAEISAEDQAAKDRVTSVANNMAGQIVEACAKIKCDYNDGSLYAYPSAVDGSVGYKISVSNTESKDGVITPTDESMISVYAHINEGEQDVYRPYEVTASTDGSHIWMDCGPTSTSMTFTGGNNWEPNGWVRTFGRPSGFVGDDEMVFDSYRVKTNAVESYAAEAEILADTLLTGAFTKLPASQLQSNIVC